MEHDNLLAEGVVDYVNGTESYAARYYQGQLFSNDVISLTEVNGSEGFVATVAAKVKQFLSWLWNTIKSIFSSSDEKHNEERVVIAKEKPVVKTFAENHRGSNVKIETHNKTVQLLNALKSGFDSTVKSALDTHVALVKEGEKLASETGVDLKQFVDNFDESAKDFDTNIFTAKKQLEAADEDMHKMGHKYNFSDYYNLLRGYMGYFWTHYERGMNGCLIQTKGVKSGGDESVIKNDLAKKLEKIADEAHQGKILGYMTKVTNAYRAHHASITKLGKTWDQIEKIITSKETYEPKEKK